jgi:hypothetical protein
VTKSEDVAENGSNQIVYGSKEDYDMKNSTVIPCPRCELVVKHGVAYWYCPGGYHPERLSCLDLALLAAFLALPLLVLITEKRRVLTAM